MPEQNQEVDCDSIDWQYSGPSGIARDSKWLTKEDLPARDTVVTIESTPHLVGVMFQGKRRSPHTVALKFAGSDKLLRTAKVHRDTLAALSGSSECGAWHGLRISLYVDPTVTFGGRVVGGVRIRSESPPAKAATEAIAT